MAATERMKALALKQEKQDAQQAMLDVEMLAAATELKQAAAALVESDIDAGSLVGRDLTAKAQPSTSGSKSGRIKALLAKHPLATNGWLAEQVYGEATKQTRANIASQLSYLKGNGVINKVDGRWVVLKP